MPAGDLTPLAALLSMAVDYVSFLHAYRAPKGAKQKCVEARSKLQNQAQKSKLEVSGKGEG